MTIHVVVADPHRSESELASLKRTASELAGSRKERPTTVHLLAAIAAKPGAASDLLLDRGLDRDALLKAGRTFDEETTDALSRALADAREVAKRARGPVSTDNAQRRQPSISPDSRLVMLEPTALHLLVALLGERRFAAFRALALSGVDAIRLRAAALTVALGVVPARRDLQRAREVAPTRLRATSQPPMNGHPMKGPTVVPLLPPQTPRAQPQRSLAPSAPPPAQPTRGAATPNRIVAAKSQENYCSPTSGGNRTSRVRLLRRRSESPPPASSERSTAEPVQSSVPKSGDTAAISASIPWLDAEVTPLLASIAVDPRGRARPKLVAREEEVERVLDVLAKHRANAPCLVGPAGVGKTSVALALAEPLSAEDAMLVEVSASSLIAGTAARGALAERISTMFEEVRRSPKKLVLFIDDLHELLGGGDEAVAELKVQLARADVRFVTATNTESLRRAVESDPQLSRRLVPVEIDEPDEEAAFLMIQSAARGLEPHHGVRYSDEALAAAVGWSIRYVPSRALPDKAIGALDYAGARLKRATAKRPLAKDAGPPEVGLSEAADAMSELASVPRERLLETDRERMLALEASLGERVVGHAEPLSKIARQLRKSAAGLRARRPLGSFLLLGPTGVGKTETAKALAESLFGAAEAMTRVDLSEYAEAHAVARLIGAPPGYVGHDAGGQLTEAVRKRPYQVLLLDEIEKAHQDVLLAFLQVLDEGHMTDGRGRKVDFTNVVVVCTSNLGSRDVATATRGKSVGFARGPSVSSRDLSEIALGAAKKGLPIELFNRFDEVLFFAPLARDEVAAVARHILDDLAAALQSRGVRLEVDEPVIEHLLDAGGYDPELGARPMKRTIARLVEGPIAEMILRDELPSGSVALLGMEDGAIVVDAMRSRATG